MTPELLRACQQPTGPLRPTFCNVPEWAEWFLYLTGLVAILVFAYGTLRHWQLWQGGRPAGATREQPAPRRWLGRFGRYVLGQQATLEWRYPGVFHLGIFWGFVLLFVGTALATIDWDVFRLLLDERLLTGPFYLGYELVLDTAGVAFTVGLLLAIWRRNVVAPHYVLGSWDFVLWSLVVINLTGFFVEGLRLVMAPVEWGGYSWVGQGLANLIFLAPADFLRDAVPVLHFGLWMTHAVAALLFIAAIPFTNAVHMFTTSAHVTLQAPQPVAPGAALQPIDLEHAAVWGVGRLADLSATQRRGVDSCTRCGRCETVCPAYLSGSPLNPKEVIVGLSNALRAELDAPWRITGEGEVIVGPGLLVEPAALFACTTCMACVQACPAFIEIVDDIVDMRRHLTLNEGALPGTAGTSLQNMGRTGNPWGYAQEDRLKWAEGLELPIARPGEHYEVLYWVGCSGSYDRRNQKIARAMVQLLRRANVSFAVMAQERCTAESGRRMGEEYLYQTATEANIAALGQFGFDRVVCHCPHCFNTIKNEYPQFGGDYEVVHHSQLLAELVSAGRLGGGVAGEARVAFHDSCYLGRYNGEFEAPRAALRAAGVQLVELERRRENGLCCGGGGGKMWFEAPAVKEVNRIRLEEALAVQPDIVGVACPFCLTMLDSAAKSLGAQDVEVLDVAEVLARTQPIRAAGTAGAGTG